jgi:methylthioribose-1-phosphate isomerase
MTRKQRAEPSRMYIRTVDYIKGKVVILDQTKLPLEESYIRIEDPSELASAISTLRVRGAPAIGVAAAHGVLLALEREIRSSLPDPPEYIFDHGSATARADYGDLDGEGITTRLLETADMLAATRPTAVNLFWALKRMKSVIERSACDAAALARNLPMEAFAIHDGELSTDRRIGEQGAALLDDGMTVLTHCNAGGLATAGFGTALAVMKTAHVRGKRISVFACETRPLLQGSRLTAWELRRAGIDVTVICDSAAASLISAGRIDAVITGADRIALSGDAANKIGTLGLAVLCGSFGVPMYIAAPWSTFDLSLPEGTAVPIEERPEEEIRILSGRRIVPDGAKVYNPAFDVTPAGMITALITETCVIRNPSTESVSEAAEKAGVLPES